jgi:iron(III) transport system substrate-binding protein
MAIPKEVTNVNSTNLMLDYILSDDGQIGFRKGGLTPYRADVLPSEVPCFTSGSIIKKLGGEDKIVCPEYDERTLKAGTDFQARWKKAFWIWRLPHDGKADRQEL